MKSPNMPPGFGQPGQIPLIGQQQAAAKAQLLHAVGQLSLGIYSHLAVTHIASRDRASGQEAEPAELEQMARDSHRAAQAYFEGLGLAQFQHNEATE